MNILILNWRDPKNPKSGGAEKLNMHILKPLIARGDTVTWYAMASNGLPAQEEYEGIKIIRFGNPLTHLIAWPFLYWAGKLGKPEFIIDSIHGTGYLSSFVAPRVKKIILICEVAQNIWDEMYPFPINILGKLWERVMFRFYGKNQFWTISVSTKKDLLDFGVTSEKIEVLPMGFDAVTLDTRPAKYKNPTALFVGRLAEMKGVKDAIRAIAEVNKKTDRKWKLIIIGRGEEEYEIQLQALVSELGQSEYISFRGYVSEKEKFEEMARVWVLLVPSSREGWGMIVPEANSVGTPAIGYDVAGLRDALRRYSSKNIIIEPNYTNIVTCLASLSGSRALLEDIKSGWKELYLTVSKKI